MPANSTSKIERRQQRQGQLRDQVHHLRTLVSDDALTVESVAAACESLKNINKAYEYDTDTFPPLPPFERGHAQSSISPRTLAEAMLWKLGRWKAYRNFIDKFEDPGAVAETTDVVLYAFGRHLIDRTLPIYDQHALRALWAIDVEFSEEDHRICKSVLFDGENRWKPTGSGPDALKGYELFVRRLANLTKRSLTANHLDRLLMPLGQALKQLFQSYDDFNSLRQPGG